VSLKTTNEIVELVLGGGAGFGDPAERSADAVARDLALGFITPEHAAQFYQQPAVPTGKEAERQPSEAWA
jgi:5-oxoprolinase (ATP-hydrolysing)/N-methylhydantoinase A